MEFSLLWAALTGVVCAWIGLRLWNERLPRNPVDRLISVTLIGLVVGRLTAMIGQGVNPLANPGEIIVIRGGVSAAAASLAFVASLVWATRRTPGAVDAVAPAVLLGLAGWHLGCVWRGACLGTPSELPWGWAQAGSLISRHPVELYAALGLGIGAVVVSRLGWRLWLRAGMALSFASGVRLLTEPLRPSLGGGPRGWYLAGLVVGLTVAMAGPVLTRGRQTAPT